jgi:hypothetical protein
VEVEGVHDLLVERPHVGLHGVERVLPGVHPA